MELNIVKVLFIHDIFIRSRVRFQRPASSEGNCNRQIGKWKRPTGEQTWVLTRGDMAQQLGNG